jgi:TATA-box binding protein (TBP) (component of TFIID and TFIIIB)
MIFLVELSDYTGKPCQSKTAYEFIPKKQIKLNLEIAKKELTPHTTIEVASKVLLIMKISGHTVSLFPSGKIIVRGEKNEEVARSTATELVKYLKESVK